MLYQNNYNQIYILFYYYTYQCKKEDMNKKANYENMQKAINQILNNISKLYDAYQAKSQKMNEQKIKSRGSELDNQYKKIIAQMKNLETKFIAVLALLEHEANMKKPKLVKYPPLLKTCLMDIQTINKKTLLYKANRPLDNLIKDTAKNLQDIQKNYVICRQTKFCGCSGIDGEQAFLAILQPFKVLAKQWHLLSQLQPKDSVETFISPKFSNKDFQFIKQTIRAYWPQQKPQTVRQVKVMVNNGKPSRLAEANQILYGINRQQNPSYGLKIYHEQAEKNDYAAACFLGQVYQDGVLLPRDLRKSVKYYQQAMNGKQPYAQYRYAMSLMKGQNGDGRGVGQQDMEAAYRLLSQLASGDQYCPQALVELGQFYQKGRFNSDKFGYCKIGIDLKKAIDYYLAARARNIPRASNNLGVLYISNKYMSQSNPNMLDKSDQNAYLNMQKGMRYLQQAEDLGFPQAFYNLGCVYQSGIFGRKNLPQALLCFYKGGIKGDLQSRLKFAYQIMNQTSIMKQHYQDHYRVAYRWLDGIVHRVDLRQQNSPVSSMIGIRHTPSQKAEASFYLGLMHQYAFGVDKNPKKAFNYYNQSSQLGYPAARNKIGDCYFSGFGTNVDKKTAIGCYLEAADMNNSDALVNLGTIYLNGIPGVVQRNYNQAYKYFFDASKDQNTNSFIHLSYMYKKGLGLQKDRQMARKLLQQAADNNNPTAHYMLKQFKGEIDDKVLLRSIADQELFSTPRRIDVNQVVPYVNQVKTQRYR